MIDPVTHIASIDKLLRAVNEVRQLTQHPSLMDNINDLLDARIYWMKVRDANDFSI